MFAIPEQFNVFANGFNTQMTMLTALAGDSTKAFDKIVKLNMSILKSSMEELSLGAKQVLETKSPKELFDMTLTNNQKNAEKAIKYSREFTNIVTGTQSEYVKATEAQFAEAKRKVSEMVQHATDNAQAAARHAVSVRKAAIMCAK